MQRTFVGKLSSEALPILIVSASIFITATALRYFILPRWNELQVVSGHLLKFQALISSESGFAQIKQDIEQKNDQLHEKLEKVSGTASDARDLASYLKLLIDKARTTDIRFVKIQPQPEETGEDFIFYPVILEMTTTYHALGRFITSLERLPHNFKVNRLSIDGEKSSKISVKLLVTCIIPKLED